jgi:transcriptional regulator with XRE-family HTH domain
MSDNWGYISRNLRVLRKARGLSQVALAEQSGISRPTIANIERGVSVPGSSVHTMHCLARALNAPVWVLLEPSLCQQDAA